jgi:hypothetical protein
MQNCLFKYSSRAISVKNGIKNSSFNGMGISHLVSIKVRGSYSLKAYDKVICKALFGHY